MQTQKLKQYCAVFWQLFKTDLAIFKDYIVEDSINIIIWITCIIVVLGYAYPAMGMPTQFGAFFAFSLIAGESYWRVWPSSFSLISDLDGDKAIEYQMMLPAPSWLPLAEKALFHAFKGLVFCFITLPLSGILLWYRIDWSTFSPLKFALMFLVLNLFNGFLFVFLASFAKKVENLRLIGIRILLPAWFLSASEFSWHVIYTKLSPVIAYGLLANPLLYMMEGMHAATLGQQDYLPYWPCLGVLTIITVIIAIAGIVRFKKRLDMV